MPRKKKPPLKLTERPQGTTKRLTLTEKIMIYAEKGTRSAEKVAVEYGCVKSTVQEVWKNEKLAKMKSRVGLVKEIMADKLYITANSSINQVNAKLPEASAAQAAVITGIMIDKARLLDDKSTQNHALQGYIGICNDIPITESLKD